MIVGCRLFMEAYFLLCLDEGDVYDLMSMITGMANLMYNCVLII